MVTGFRVGKGFQTRGIRLPGVTSYIELSTERELDRWLIAPHQAFHVGEIVAAE